MFSRAIVDPLVEEGFNRDLLEAISSEIQIALKVKKTVKGRSSAENEGEDDSDTEFDAEIADQKSDKDTEQAFMLGRAEIEYLKAQARKIAQGDDGLRRAVNEKPKAKQLSKWQKDIKKILGTRELKPLKDNLAAMGISARLPRGLEAALFGRMVTSDLIANTDAAIHVAHAFTVHREEAETDYFTVVDDLAREGETGAGGIFDTELTSGLFYVYVVVDVSALIANLADDAPLAGKVVEPSCI